MWFRAGLALLALAGVFLEAQVKLTVQQLGGVIESSIRLKHTDKQVADYLKRVTLAERLDERTIETWQGLGAGPKTLEALRALAAGSTALPAPKAPEPKPAPPTIPPPSPEDQARVLGDVRTYALGYTKRLPDFICTQVTRRYVDPSGLEFWQTMDTITERLTYFDRKEEYKVILVNGRPSEATADRLGGSKSSGEFGSIMSEIFDPKTETDFRWTRWATLRGRRNHVYSFAVTTPKSKYQVTYERTMSIISGYQGSIYVDAEYNSITRIVLRLNDIPADFPVQAVNLTLDYDFVSIGGTQHILPLRAEVRSREGKNLTKNDVEFRLYRKFGADATIKFETPDPLPADAVEEQPAKPPAKQ